MNDLNARLLKAHETGKKSDLVILYTQAADKAADIDAEAFYLTQAYIFGLETAHVLTPNLKARLTALNRDTP